MKIIYDDLYELAEVAIRCNDTVRKGRCEWCPFYDRCQIDTPEMRHILCAEVDGYIRSKKGGGSDE